MIKKTNFVVNFFLLLISNSGCWTHGDTSKIFVEFMFIALGFAIITAVIAIFVNKDEKRQMAGAASIGSAILFLILLLAA